MIKKMRIKFIAITMTSLLIFLAVILTAMNIYMNNRWDDQITNYLTNQVTREENGEINTRGQSTADSPELNGNLNDTLPDIVTETIPNELPDTVPDTVNQMQGFTVFVDNEGNITDLFENRTSLTSDEISTYTADAIKSGESSGESNSMRYLIEEKDDGKIIAFANNSMKDTMLEELRNLSILIGTISIAVLFVIVSGLSYLVTKPVEEDMKKQKAFISDSSHELKTPLSILSANADMLESEIGKNKRLNEISIQSKRMNQLINELLILARNENAGSEMIFTPFNISHAIINTLLPFEVIAFEQKKEIEYDIPDNVTYIGSEKNIKRMIEALTDNAIKYAYPKTTISVKLYLKNGKTCIEVHNEGRGVTEEQKKHLFDKFYRTDDSRSRETGSYGIGLSLVKSIVDMHKGKIEIYSTEKKDITFKVVLP